jgi:AcrR family transcriptional regulator
MDMIAGQMGISKRTIYELFRDKEDLLQGVSQVDG